MSLQQSEMPNLANPRYRFLPLELDFRITLLAKKALIKNLCCTPKKQILGFKGGTVIYLFYDLNRFLVDLDFDLLNASKKGYVFENVKKILEEYGVIRESRENRAIYKQKSKITREVILSTGRLTN